MSTFDLVVLKISLPTIASLLSVRHSVEILHFVGQCHWCSRDRAVPFERAEEMLLATCRMGVAAEQGWEGDCSLAVCGMRRNAGFVGVGSGVCITHTRAVFAFQYVNGPVSHHMCLLETSYYTETSAYSRELHLKLSGLRRHQGGEGRCESWDLLPSASGSAALTCSWALVMSWLGTTRTSREMLLL